MRCLLPRLLVFLSIAPVYPAAAAAPTGTEAVLLQNAQTQPDSFEANRLLGQFYIRRHKLAAALPWLEKAHAIDPKDYENGYDLALACLETGKIPRSREVITTLLLLKDTAELHNLLGDVAEAEGKVQEAASQYELAARMNPSEKNLFDLGSDLLRHRGYDAALRVFRFATGRYPRSAQLRVGLGIAHYSLGQYDEAVESLCQAVDLEPKDTRALDFLGRMVDVSPQSGDEVTRRLARFVKLYPDNSAANYYYAMSLRKRASSSDGASDGAAQELLEKAVKLNPKFADAHYQLGLLYEDHRQDEKAIREYEAALRVRPEMAKIHYRLGRLYQKSGRAALARREFDAFEATKAKPE